MRLLYSDYVDIHACTVYICVRLSLSLIELADLRYHFAQCIISLMSSTTCVRAGSIDIGACHILQRCYCAYCEICELHTLVSMSFCVVLLTKTMFALWLGFIDDILG